MGGWWSASRSDEEFATRGNWRSANAVCRGWNRRANHIFSCTMPTGSLLFVGSSQSADCDKLTKGSTGDARSTDSYPTSSTQQIYVMRGTLKPEHCANPQPLTRWTDLTPKN
jgi:hypothetical protein